MKRFAMMALTGMILLGCITITTNAATIRVPGDYPTIQAGVNAAVNGDTVLVADGTYRGYGNYDIRLQGKIITLQSENGYEGCIIDCQEIGSGVYAGNPGSMIRGFTIMNALDEWYYGGVVGYYGGTVADCLITNNWIGVYSSDCSTGCILDNCIIEGSTIGIYTCFACVDASNCIIRGNGNATYSDVMVIDKLLQLLFKRGYFYVLTVVKSICTTARYNRRSVVMSKVTFSCVTVSCGRGIFTGQRTHITVFNIRIFKVDSVARAISLRIRNSLQDRLETSI